MTSASIVEEDAVTMVAGLFTTPVAAATAARELQNEMPLATVRLVQPGDLALPGQLEPDPPNMLRTAIRTHVVLAITGALLGALLGGGVLSSGWEAAESSPLATLMATTLGGAVLGMLLAGVMTLRADRSDVIRQVQHSVRQGQWAVVAHPAGQAQAASARSLLSDAGGRIVRTL
ncbi:MAG: hypothetical protein Q7T87_15670 [Polaromonas sp.]|nr:hypothetical protein [Polaromonas sp.]